MLCRICDGGGWAALCRLWSAAVPGGRVAEAKAARRAELGPWWRRVLRFGR
jgi:hypothetical protein